MRAVRFILALLFALLAASPAALAKSVNDDRSAAIPLARDQISAIDTTNNTIESGEPNTTSGGCQPAGGTTNGALVGATEWYTAIGTGGPITITTDEPTPATPPQQSAGDTLVFVYPHGSNTALACNDEISATDLRSTVTFSSSAGQSYDIQVGQFSLPPQFPPGGLTVTSERPANDGRAFPTAVTVAGGSVSASNNAATTEAGEVLACPRSDGTTVPYGRTVWFRFHATVSGMATFVARGGSLDAVEAVYSGVSPEPLACQDGAATGSTSVSVPVSAGDYLVQVGGASGARGSWSESVSFAPASTTTLISSAPRARVGRSLTYLASVTPVPSGGTVSFSDNGTAIARCGAVPVDPNTGNATCDVSYPAVGRHSIVAGYSGAAGASPPSASGPLSEVVALTKTRTSLSLSLRRRPSGGRLTATARVSPVPVGGRVMILAAGKALRGCGALRPNPRSGVVRCRPRFRLPGRISLSARFGGSAGYEGSSSRKRTLVVAPRR